MNMKLKWVILLSIFFLIAGVVVGYFVGFRSGYNYYSESLKSIESPPPIPYIDTELNLEWLGRVSRIVDGDTLEIDGNRIRLSLVDTPERGEAGFTEATQFTASLCPVGSIAQVDVDDGQPTDKYGRTVAVIYCGGKNLNAELWKNGYARIDDRFLSVSEFDPYSW